MHSRGDMDVFERGYRCILEEIGMYPRGDKDVTERRFL